MSKETMFAAMERDPALAEAVAYAHEALPDPVGYGLQRSRHIWIPFDENELRKFFPHDPQMHQFKVLFHLDVDSSNKSAAEQIAAGKQIGVWVPIDYRLKRLADRGPKSAVDAAREKREAMRQRVAEEMADVPVEAPEPPKPAAKKPAAKKPAVKADPIEPPAEKSEEWSLDEE